MMRRVRGDARLWLALLTTAAFANAIPNGFVWIDHWQVESGGLIARSWAELLHSVREPLGALPSWQGSAPYVRPMVVVVLSLIHRLTGASPAAYHLAVLVIHLSNVLLVYDLFCALAVERSSAFLVSAIFAVHPLQTAAVSWISGIADPLFSVFVLLALRAELAASARRSIFLHGAAVLSFAAALGAKETAVVFPPLLIAVHLLFPSTLGQHTLVRRARAIARAVAPFLFVLAGDVLYRVMVLKRAALGSGFGAIPFTVRLRTAPRLVMSYLTLPLRFTSLTVCDDYALSGRWDGWTIVSLVAVVALVGVVSLCWRRWPHAVLGVVWMLLGLTPVLNVMPILHYRADRFFYFPFIGWTLACVVLLRAGMSALQRRHGGSRKDLRRGAALLAAVTLLLLATLTIRRNLLFADDVTLFESTMQVSPFCREAHTTLGDAYLRSGRSAEAVAAYERARTGQLDRASYVVMPKVLINLGVAQLDQGQYGAAEAAFSDAHRLQPDLLHPLFGLGVANLGLGRVFAAVSWLEQAYSQDPRDPDVMFNLALGYDRLGRGQEALALYQRYLDTTPHGGARVLARDRVRELSAPGR